MSRELADMRQDLEEKVKDEDIEILTDEEQEFNRIIRRVIPIPFEQYRNLDGNKQESDLIIKAFDYYLSRLDMIEDVKARLKNEKFTQKGFFDYANKPIKTILNQKDKYSALLKLLDILQDKYEHSSAKTLRNYMKKGEYTENTEPEEKGLAIITKDLIKAKEQNTLLKDKIEEINNIIDSSENILELKEQLHKIIDNIEDLDDDKN